MQLQKCCKMFHNFNRTDYNFTYSRIHPRSTFL